MSILPDFMQPSGQKNQAYIEVDWAMFGELCRALALKVARDYDPDAIVGIARAGVIPAAVEVSITRVDCYSLSISRRGGGTTVRARPALFRCAAAG
jgi:hypoxanthine phosphoribosyltransferase